MSICNGMSGIELMGALMSLHILLVPNDCCVEGDYLLCNLPLGCPSFLHMHVIKLVEVS